jgi:predicted transcriptional regulator
MPCRKHPRSARRIHTFLLAISGLEQTSQDRFNQSDICEFLDLSVQQVHDATRYLLKEELVEFKDNGRDKYYISLTEKGRQVSLRFISSVLKEKDFQKNGFSFSFLSR